MKPSPASRLAILLLLPCLHGMPAHALPDDREQPLRITANQAEQDEKRGLTVYRGNVLIVQGSIQLTADEVQIFSENGEVVRLDAHGLPAVLRQKPAVNKELVWARGKLVRYHLADEHLELIGQASLEQEGSTVSSERIDYYIQKRLVKAAGDGSGSQQRVEVVLPPKKAAPAPAPATAPSSTSGNGGSTH